MIRGLIIQTATIAFALVCANVVAQDDIPFVTERIELVPEPNALARVGQYLGLSDLKDTYSIALVTGVDSYPLMNGGEILEAAVTDRSTIIDSLSSVGMNEILVLWNADFNLENIKSLAEGYLSEKMAAFPRARFVHAHTGHGISEGDIGYLLTHLSNSYSDTTSAISLKDLNMAIEPAIVAAYQSLFLLNSCYSGEYFHSFGGEFVPENPGSHVITAGGSDERTWGTKATGSVFFDAVARGLAGAADSLPINEGDGIVTTHELYGYLRQSIQRNTNHRQNPKIADLRIHDNDGEHFFTIGASQPKTEKLQSFNSVLVSFGQNDLIEYRGQSESQFAYLSVTPESSVPLIAGDMSSKGGTMTVGLLFDPREETIAYRDISFESEEINLVFADRVRRGISNPTLIDVEVTLNFRAYIRLDKTTNMLSVFGGNKDKLKIDDFFTSHCQFSCYDIELWGQWVVKVGDEKWQGRIDAYNLGHGVGADAMAAINPNNIGDELKLANFFWQGNHNVSVNGFDPIIDRKFSGLPIKITIPSMGFTGHGQRGEEDPIVLTRLQ